jgi:phosphoribosylformimino-5-aminoimidazole carboxamide ribotide isomerase
MRIYPAIDLRGGRCVRLVQGDYSRETVFGEDPVAMAQHWVNQGAQQLHLVDLDGAKAGQPINGEVIERIAKSVTVPCQLGGGIRNSEHLKQVFSWGIRWAVLGTKALQDPAWVRQVAEEYPEQIVLGLDARNGYVATEGWLTTSETSAIELAQQVQDAPLFAIVYTDIARDGMLNGPNYEQLAQMRSACTKPVIASGGVSNLEQVQQLADAGTFGCIIGRALYEGHIDLRHLLQLFASRDGPQSLLSEGKSHGKTSC